jgi:[ribosomal protein S18]-alanine N-acetyltransferase
MGQPQGKHTDAGERPDAAAGLHAARARIPSMQSRDLPRVCAMEAACFGAEAWPREAFRELLHAFDRVRPSRGGLWVAEERRTGEILGYVGVEVSALKGEMDIINVAVAPGRRRQGVGRLLLGWVLRRCRQQGVPLLWLRVRASNRGARAFYRRLGFQPRGRFEAYYQDPDEAAILMARDLDPGPIYRCDDRETAGTDARSA